MEGGQDGVKPQKEQEIERIKLQKFESEIQAWEEKEKAKIDNKAKRLQSEIEAIMKKKEADREAKLKNIETEAERFKQLKLEKLNNEEALAQRTIEQRKASIEAQIETEKLKLGEKASKLRSAKALPKKCFGFCGE